jgi:hypothetical protein
MCPWLRGIATWGVSLGASESSILSLFWRALSRYMFPLVFVNSHTHQRGCVEGKAIPVTGRRGP